MAGLVEMLADQGLVQSGPEGAALILGGWRAINENLDPRIVENLIVAAGRTEQDVARLRNAVISEGIHPIGLATSPEQAQERYELVLNEYNGIGRDGNISRGDTRFQTRIDERPPEEIQTQVAGLIFSRENRSMWVNPDSFGVLNRPQFDPADIPRDFTEQFHALSGEMTREADYADEGQLNNAVRDRMARNLGWRLRQINGGVRFERNPLDALPGAEGANAREWAENSWSEIMADDENGVLAMHRGKTRAQLERQGRAVVTNIARPGQPDEYRVIVAVGNGRTTRYDIGHRTAQALQMVDRAYRAEIAEPASVNGWR